MASYFGHQFSFSLLGLFLDYILWQQFFGLGLVIDGQANRFSINEKFQLQESFQGVLASSYPSLDLVKNLGIFEKTTKGFVYRPSSEIKKINFTLLSNDSLKVTLITREDINTEYSDTTVRLPK